MDYSGEAAGEIRNWSLLGVNPLLPGVINFKFALRPHQKYYITKYEELGFS